MSFIFFLGTSHSPLTGATGSSPPRRLLSGSPSPASCGRWRGTVSRKKHRAMDAAPRRSVRQCFWSVTGSGPAHMLTFTRIIGETNYISINKFCPKTGKSKLLSERASHIINNLIKLKGTSLDVLYFFSWHLSQSSHRCHREFTAASGCYLAHTLPLPVEDSPTV